MKEKEARADSKEVFSHQEKQRGKKESPFFSFSSPIPPRDGPNAATGEPRRNERRTRAEVGETRIEKESTRFITDTNL